MYVNLSSNPLPYLIASTCYNNDACVHAQYCEKPNSMVRDTIFSICRLRAAEENGINGDIPFLKDGDGNLCAKSNGLILTNLNKGDRRWLPNVEL